MVCRTVIQGLVCVAFLATVIARGQDTTPPQPPGNPPSNPDPFSMDLDSLLNTKVITASKFPEDLSQAPSAMTVVTADELKRFRGMTLAEVLSHVAGITTTTNYFQDRQMVAIQGDQVRQDGGHILILINGRPNREVLSGGTISDILESFPVDVLERIEVIQGPGSVLYGSNAFSGVINLITKKSGGAEQYHLQSAGASTGAIADSAEVYFKHSDLNVVAAGQYHGTPPSQIQYDNQLGPGLPFTLQTPLIRQNSVGGFLELDYKDLKFESSYTAGDSPSFVYTAGESRSKRGFFDVGYSKAMNSKWEANLNLTYSRNVNDIPTYPDTHSDSDETVLEWSNRFILTDKDSLTFGLLFDHIRGTGTVNGASPVLIVAQGSRGAGGLYGEYERKLTSSLKLIGGFQANKIGPLALNVVPRVGVVWSPFEHYTVKALYGGAYRAPSISETLINFSQVKGNRLLLPEEVGTFNLEFGHQTNHLEWVLGYFHSRQIHDIGILFNGYTGVYANSSNPFTFNGFQGEGKRYLKRDWLLIASVLYQSNHDSLRQTHISPVPNFGAKAGISYSNERGIEVSAFDAYEGHIAGYAASPDPRPNAWHSIDAQARFDISQHLSKDNPFGFAAFLHANNLANYRQWLPDLSSAYPPITVPYSLGRTIFFGVEFWQKAE